MKRVVLDASVVLKWYLMDEEYSKNAIELLERYVTDQLEIICPALLEYEVINGLIIARRIGRIEEKVLLKAIEGFINLEIELRNLSYAYPKLLHYCKVYNRSVYDASYLALADTEGFTFVTADKDLYNSVSRDNAWVKWIGDI